MRVAILIEKDLTERVTHVVWADTVFLLTPIAPRQVADTMEAEKIGSRGRGQHLPLVIVGW